MKTASLYRPVFVLLYLTIIGLAVYSPVLDGDFICDDYVFLSYNQSIRHFPDLRPIWSSFPTRFLVFVSFAVNYAVHGFRVPGFHLVNMCIHIFNSFFVYIFVRQLFKSPFVRRTSACAGASAAFWAALVFLCHPIQTQGVAYIFQRATCLATLFYMLTLVLYLKFRLGSGRWAYGLAVGSFLCAVFCKEMVVTLPGALLLCELFFFSPGPEDWGKLARRLLPFLLLCAVLVVVFLSTRVDEGGLTLNKQVAGSQFSSYFFLTEVNVLRTYLRLLAFPALQRFEYDYPVVKSFAETRTWFSAVLLLGLLGYAGVLFRRNRILSFCVFWFFLTTSVEVAVVSLVHRALLFEHWLYLPMVGFSIFLVCFLCGRLEDEEGFKRVCFILILSLCVMTVLRNQVWRNEIRFWEYEAALSPRKLSVNYEAGVACDRKGYKTKALSFYSKAAELVEEKGAATRLDRVTTAKLYNNIGIIYTARGEYSKAREAFEKARSFDSLAGGVERNLRLLLDHPGARDEKEPELYGQ